MLSTFLPLKSIIPTTDKMLSMQLLNLDDFKLLLFGKVVVLGTNKACLTNFPIYKETLVD